jgi:hypothetical protein
MRGPSPSKQIIVHLQRRAVSHSTCDAELHRSVPISNSGKASAPERRSDTVKSRWLSERYCSEANGYHPPRRGGGPHSQVRELFGSVESAKGPPTYKLRIKNDGLGVRMSEHNSSHDSSAGMLSAGRAAKTSLRLTTIRGVSRLLLCKPRPPGASSPTIPIYAQMKNLYIISGATRSWNCGRLVLNTVKLLHFQVPRKTKHSEYRNPIPVQI